jgi:hypothetical protein
MKSLSRYGLVCMLLVAILLGWYSSVLSERLDKANQANKELLEDVENRNATITALKDAAGVDRRATEQQLKIEQQKRAKADADNGILRKALEDNHCSDQRLPADALNLLR